jgi:hypothetical protein
MCFLHAAAGGVFSFFKEVFEMRNKRWTLWVFLFVAMFAFMAGGCGGGGGGDKSNPDPVPEPDPAPIPGNEAKFAELEGTWIATAGLGAATGPGGPYRLLLENDGYSTITVVQIENNTRALLEVTEAFDWELMKDYTPVRVIALRSAEESVVVDYIERDTYSYTTLSGNRRSIKISGAYNSALMEETGTLTDSSGSYSYTAEYVLTRVR